MGTRPLLMTGLLPMLLPILLVAAPATPAQAASPLSYTKAQIKKAAKRMADKMEMPAAKRAETLKTLGKVMREKKMLKAFGTDRVRGVFAYFVKEGGVFVKFVNGRGQMEFRALGEDGSVVVRTRVLTFKATSVGAQIGGSHEWGIGLIVDMKDIDDLGGKYKGEVLGSVAATVGTMITTMTRVGSKEKGAKAKAHHVYMIGRASGLSANFGASTLTIGVKKR